MDIQIFSSYESWYIQVLNSKMGETIKTYHWNHNDFKNGAGGEKLFGELLEFLGYNVIIEGVA